MRKGGGVLGELDTTCPPVATSHCQPLRPQGHVAVWLGSWSFEEKLENEVIKRNVLILIIVT